MKKLQALILSPVDASYRHIADEIQHTIQASGATPITVDNIIHPGGAWVNAMTDAIQEADIILADVSRKSSNIFFELGVAFALRKPTMLLLSTDAAGDIPSEISGYLMITYDPKDLSSLKETISRFIKYQESRWSGKNA